MLLVRLAAAFLLLLAACVLALASSAKVPRNSAPLPTRT